MVERVGYLAGDPERVFQWELLLPNKAGPQALALYVGHGKPEIPVGLTGVVHWKDVRVLEPSRDPDLPEEAIRAERRGELVAQDLQGDEAVVPEVASEVNRCHAPAAQLALDHITVPQGTGQGSSRPIGHGRTWSGALPAPIHLVGPALANLR